MSWRGEKLVPQGEISRRHGDIVYVGFIYILYAWCLAEEETGGKERAAARKANGRSFRWPFKARTFRSVTVFRVQRRATSRGGHLRVSRVLSATVALFYKRPSFLVISRVKRNWTRSLFAVKRTPSLRLFAFLRRFLSISTLPSLSHSFF